MLVIWYIIQGNQEQNLALGSDPAIVKKFFILNLESIR